MPGGSLMTMPLLRLRILAGVVLALIIVLTLYVAVAMRSGSTALRPKEPKFSVKPALAFPWMRPSKARRKRVFFGCIMAVSSLCLPPRWFRFRDDGRAARGDGNLRLPDAGGDGSRPRPPVAADDRDNPRPLRDEADAGGSLRLLRGAAGGNLRRPRRAAETAARLLLREDE